MQVQQTLRQLVHAQQLVDRHVGERMTFFVLRESAAQELETVPYVRNRIADLMSQLAHELTGSRKTVALHQFALQLRQPMLTLGELTVRGFELRHTLGERLAHGVKGAGQPIELVDTTRAHWSAEVARRKPVGCGGERLRRSRERGGNESAKKQRYEERGAREQEAEPPNAWNDCQLGIEVAYEEYGRLGPRASRSNEKATSTRQHLVHRVRL
jgi:hypothetical protein